MKNKKLIFIQLNELNFEFLDPYLDTLKLKSFKKLINDGFVETSSENKYSSLEPWIQWASISTGKTFKEHKIFRLGDILNYKGNQIYETLEKKGLNVGAISPMNVENRMQNPSYFIPDPWTNTKSDDSFWSRNISKMINQVVNDNSKGKASLYSIIILFLSIIRFGNFKNYTKYLYYFISSYNKKWRRALFLDLLLHDIHLSFLRKKVNFSSIFFNGLAHIQHHYFLNSKANKNELNNPDWYISKNLDPFAEALILYDKIIDDYINFEAYDLILATGLRQVPFHEVKYYYRLKDHTNFLKNLKINFLRVEPRMTGDFLIHFRNVKEANEAQNKLSKVLTDENIRIFDEIENRGLTLFLTLTYDKQINEFLFITNGSSKIKLFNYVDFVGIKNGKHDGKGYFYSRGIPKKLSLEAKDHVSKIYNLIDDYFAI